MRAPYASSVAESTRVVRDAGPPPDTCMLSSTAFRFQPAIVGTLAAIGAVFQEPAIFFAIMAALCWTSLMPRRNPFDAIWNRWLADRPGAIPLPTAPAPRRFSQGLGATFALGIGVALLAGWTVAAIVLQAMLVGAFASVVFLRFCPGAFVWYLITGRPDYAMRTLPGARPA